MSDGKIGFHFGALVPKLKEQLAGFDITLPVGDLDTLQRAADSITYLSIQDFLSDAETRKARQRLVRRIENLVAAIRKEPAHV